MSATQQRAAVRETIRARAQAAVRNYLSQEPGGVNFAASLTSAIEHVQREYKDRFLYELVQNAYDAHRGGVAGEIVVLLDATEEEAGVLYVANGGEAFTDSNFEAITDFARSDKRPDESIGNKGVGFKSVLQVCDLPEVYSARVRGRAGATDFDGYCFSFAATADYLELAGGDTGLAADLERDVARYFLPIALTEQPATVRAFAAAGLATVIRLPLRDEAALRVARERLEWMRTSQAPVHLFLERLSSLRIEVRERDAEPACVTLRREGTPIKSGHSSPDQRYERADLGTDGEWFIAWRRADADLLRAAIAESVAAKELDPAWEEWDEDAWVAVAVRLDGAPVAGRMYTYLPMEREAGAPFHGHLHAPFSTKLARTTVSPKVPLNRTLLDVAAEAAAAAALAFPNDPQRLTEPALVDLVAWDVAHRDRITRAFDSRGVQLRSAELVPIDPLPDGRSRCGFDRVYRWLPANMPVINAPRLVKDAGAHIASESLGAERIARADTFSREFFFRGLDPAPKALGIWMEALALSLAASRAGLRTWDGFYADLATVMRDYPGALRGRRVLLGMDDEVHAIPDADAGTTVGPLVFFSPARERTEGEDEVERDVDIDPPAVLAKRLVLMHDGLRWSRREGNTRRHTEARSFLQRNRLVREWRVGDLLEHIGRALGQSSGRRLAAASLTYAYRLFVASTSVRTDALRAAGLRVPTADGRWRLAREAYFSEGWGTELGGSLQQLTRRAAGASDALDTVAAQLLAAPSEWPVSPDNRACWVRFLVAAGVRDGLWPAVRQLQRDPVGDEVVPGVLARRLGLDELTAGWWRAAVSERVGWRAAYPQTAYKSEEPVTVIPGQGDLDHLPSAARSLWAELVIVGLEHWPDSALTVTWIRSHPRHRRSPDARAWPSPIAAFLARAAWFPIVVPADRREDRFSQLRTAWHYPDDVREDPPTFSPLASPSARRRLRGRGRAEARLRNLGLGVWTDPAHAVRLLAHLAELLESGELRSAAVPQFRRVYRQAWHLASERPLDEVAEALSQLPIVVSLRGTLAIAGPDETVYVAGRGRSFASSLLDAAGLGVLQVDDRDLQSVLDRLDARPVEDAAATRIEVEVDGGPFDSSASEPLVRPDRRWLETLVALVLEARTHPFDRSGDRRRREVLQRLREARVASVHDFDVLIDGISVGLPASLRGVIPLSDGGAPVLVVARDQPQDTLSLHDLASMCPGVCELLGIADYTPTIQLALERLALYGRLGVVGPSDADLAAATDVDERHVREVRSDVAAGTSQIVETLAPVVAYFAGPVLAAELIDRRDDMSSEADVIEFLSAHGDAFDRPLQELVGACAEGLPLSGVRERLGLDYGHFNAALSSLAPRYEPVHNEMGHKQALENYKARHRDELVAAVRRRFLRAFAEGRDLSAYVEARTLAPLRPDPVWLDAYLVPPEEVLHDHAQQWLNDLGDTPDTAAPTLEPLEEVRVANRSVLAPLAARAAELIPVWCEAHDVRVPDVWRASASERSLWDAALTAGTVDFVCLSADQLLALVQTLGHWPSGMPLSVEPHVLKVDPTQADSAAEKRRREREERARRQRIVVVDGTEFSADDVDLEALVAHIQANPGELVLGATRRTTQLAHLPEKRPGGGGGGERNTRAHRRREEASPAQRIAIGLVGEVAAYAWLEVNYPDVFSPECWISSYRELAGYPAGDDDAGYDFRIALKTRTLFFEVKATPGSDTRFQLSENELGVARDCTGRTDLDYRILFVPQVLDSSYRTLYVLPNPMDPVRRHLYRFPGAGLTCHFKWLD